MRLLSTSLTAITLAISLRRVSGRSCPLAILPKPICPILILLLGASFPNTEAGTMVGKPVIAREAATAPLVVDFIKLRLERVGLLSFFIAALFISVFVNRSEEHTSEL